MSDIREPINVSDMFADASDLINEPDVCTICRSEMREVSNVHTLPECGHTFHTDCLIPWLRRSSNCPNCRGYDDGRIGEQYMVDLSKYRFNMNFSRRKNAPKQLKSLVSKLRKRREKKKAISLAKKEWLASSEGLEYKRLCKKFNKIYHRYRRWRYFSEERVIKAQIANYPINPVFVRVKIRHRPRPRLERDPAEP